MSDRSQTGHTDGTTKSDYQTEAAYFLDCKETQVILSRINGLFPPDMAEWVAILPNDNRVVSALQDRKEGIHMNSNEQEAWATHLIEANQAVFEQFVDREEDEKVLTMIVEAEANRDAPRPERIGYVNQRKQEL